MYYIKKLLIPGISDGVEASKIILFVDITGGNPQV
jgi:hypothetical protein